MIEFIVLLICNLCMVALAWDYVREKDWKSLFKVLLFSNLMFVSIAVASHYGAAGRTQ